MAKSAQMELTSIHVSVATDSKGISAKRTWMNVKILTSVRMGGRVKTPLDPSPVTVPLVGLGRGVKR